MIDIDTSDSIDLLTARGEACMLFSSYTIDIANDLCLNADEWRRIPKIHLFKGCRIIRKFDDCRITMPCKECGDEVSFYLKYAAIEKILRGNFISIVLRKNYPRWTSMQLQSWTSTIVSGVCYDCMRG